MAPCRRTSVPRSDAERMETDRGSCPFISGGERSSCVQPCPGADDPEMAERRPGMAKMVKVPGAKHELFGTRGRMLQTYWNMVFAFLEKICNKREGMTK